jgi:hypothetical protein
MSRTRFHILSQYIWPDGGPDGILAEQLAARLQEIGHAVLLVGGKGVYRISGREKPNVPLVYVDHQRGRRGNLAQTFAQYWAVKRGFEKYIQERVQPGDIVIATSAPPTSVWLAGPIKRRGAFGIHWLQDYYPELVRALWEYPLFLRWRLNRLWHAQLLQWDRVVKSAANLAGPVSNSVVVRNWPTLGFDQNVTPEAGTALYCGNLGHAHDVGLLVAACARLRDEGYRITIRADGGGTRELPDWLRAQPLHGDPKQLKDDLLRHEIHLVAAHPRIQRAIFPSKIWNSIAAGRRLICTGFAGAMLEELEASRAAQFDQHVDKWIQLLTTREMGRQPLSVAA